MLGWLEAPGGFAWVGLTLLLVYELGWRWGKKRSSGASPALLAAFVVWLGLMQGACLFQALQKHQEQTNAVHSEADAVAHVYRVLETLPKAQRTQMRLLLIAYLEAKLANKASAVGKLQEEILGLQSQLYLLGTNFTSQKVLNELRGSQLELLLNQMISLHYRTDYAMAEGLPPTLLGWLATLSVLVAFGMGASAQGQRNWSQSLLGIILLSSSWVLLVDTNRPRTGSITVDTTNYRDLVDILHHQEQL